MQEGSVEKFHWLFNCQFWQLQTPQKTCSWHAGMEFRRFWQSSQSVVSVKTTGKNFDFPGQRSSTQISGKIFSTRLATAMLPSGDHHVVSVNK
jgi:hypothetical protein